MRTVFYCTDLVDSTGNVLPRGQYSMMSCVYIFLALPAWRTYYGFSKR